MGSHWQALDPLLAMMMHYDDDHDLSRKIDSLYQVLDSDQNGSLGYEELVESFKKIPVGARARARFSSSKAFCLRLFRTHADARLVSFRFTLGMWSCSAINTMITITIAMSMMLITTLFLFPIPSLPTKPPEEEAACPGWENAELKRGGAGVRADASVARRLCVDHSQLRAVR
eukprot:739092-Rhodomonas_salina.1